MVGSRYDSNMKICVTGGAGFIGSNLVERLVIEGHEVTIIDNFSTGDERFLPPQIKGNINLFELDLSQVDETSLVAILKDVELVFHLAANADVRGGWETTFIDIQHNVIATHNIAVAARKAGVRQFVFASTGCVYGDSTVIPTPEDEPFPIQTSLYGASKVAAEGILSTFAMNEAFAVTVFRFVSVLGRYYHHGHVVDFVRQLLNNPSELRILGDGHQKKSYISVEDCVDALVSLRGLSRYEVFNIGQTDFCEVRESASIISSVMNVRPKFITGSETRGWVGDNPFTFLDTTKAQSHGWHPSRSIEESIALTVDWLLSHRWALSLDDSRKLSHD